MCRSQLRTLLLLIRLDNCFYEHATVSTHVFFTRNLRLMLRFFCVSWLGSVVSMSRSGKVCPVTFSVAMMMVTLDHFILEFGFNNLNGSTQTVELA